MGETTIRRDEVEARVLKALEEKLLNQELFEEFCEEFTREMNRLRGEHRANMVAGERGSSPDSKLDARSWSNRSWKVCLAQRSKTSSALVGASDHRSRR